MFLIESTKGFFGRGDSSSFRGKAIPSPPENCPERRKKPSGQEGGSSSVKSLTLTSAKIGDCIKKGKKTHLREKTTRSKKKGLARHSRRSAILPNLGGQVKERKKVFGEKPSIITGSKKGAEYARP